MKKRDLTQKLVTVTIVLLLAICVVGIFAFVQKNMGDKKEVVTTSTPVVTTPTPISTPALEPYEFDAETLAGIQQEYRNAKAINDDIRCFLVFQSNLVHQPVVQGETNETYLRTNWETREYDEMGSIFMDYEDIFEQSQNTIIYGHYVYESYNADRTLMFTPLEQLKNEDNYLANQYFALVTDTTISYYQISVVADIPTVDGYPPEGLNWLYPNYDAEYLNQFLYNIMDYAYYDSGVTITPDDSFVTLQTCIENEKGNRLIVLAKKIK